MLKSPIKVKLKILKSLTSEHVDYRIERIDNAVTIGAVDGSILRKGDTITEKQAEYLTKSYLVTVV